MQDSGPQNYLSGRHIMSYHENAIGNVNDGIRARLIV